MGKEKERHRCALKLLPFFYTSEELSNSNNDGTHNKQQLDVTKLQALKVLVFSRFPIESHHRRKKKCGSPSKVKLTRSVTLANMYISLLVPSNVNKVELTLCCLASIGCVSAAVSWVGIFCRPPVDGLLNRLLSFCLYHLDSSFLVLLTIILTAPLGA